MTHARTNQMAAAIVALALTIAVAFSTTTAPATARTFEFNSTGSMVQQPLPPQWACAMQRALSPGTPKSRCRQPSARQASAIREDHEGSARAAA